MVLRSEKIQLFAFGGLRIIERKIDILTFFACAYFFLHEYTFSLSFLEHASEQNAWLPAFATDLRYKAFNRSMISNDQRLK